MLTATGKVHWGACCLDWYTGSGERAVQVLVVLGIEGLTLDRERECGALVCKREEKV